MNKSRNDPPFTLEIEGLNPYTKRLALLEARIKLPFRKTGAAGLIRRDHAQESARQIKAGQAGGYARLSEGYEAWKSRVRPGKKILVFDGDLVESFTNPNSSNFDVNVKDRGKRLVMLTEIPYAKYHQKGTPRMPARPPFVANGATSSRWIKILHDEIIKGV